MGDQSRETRKLNSIGENVGNRQVYFAVLGEGLMIEMVVWGKDSADIVRLGSVVENRG